MRAAVLPGNWAPIHARHLPGALLQVGKGSCGHASLTLSLMPSGHLATEHKSLSGHVSIQPWLLLGHGSCLGVFSSSSHLQQTH